MKPEEIIKRLIDEVYTGPQPEPQPQPEPEPEPQSQRSITIGDILAALPAGTDDVIIEIMNTENDSIRMAKRLKDILQPQAAALEKIGLIPDYTAYMLVAVAQRMRGIQ